MRSSHSLDRIDTAFDDYMHWLNAHPHVAVTS